MSGSNRSKQGSTDESVSRKYKKYNQKLFNHVYGAISTKTTAGKALRLQIQDEFGQERDGYALVDYLKAWAASLSDTEISKIKSKIRGMSFKSNESPEKWWLRSQKLKDRWQRVPVGRREGDEKDLVNMLLEKVRKVEPTYVNYMAAPAARGLL